MAQRTHLASLVDPDTAVTVITPSRGWVALQLGDVWAYRELLYFLVWRDIKVRYKQTILGAAWAVLQPFTTMVVFSLFFGRLAQIPSDGVPYPLFSYAALVPWTFFAYGLTQSSSSLVDGANLLTRLRVAACNVSQGGRQVVNIDGFVAEPGFNPLGSDLG